jgi:hypothetical protein
MRFMMQLWKEWVLEIFVDIQSKNTPSIFQMIKINNFVSYAWVWNEIFRFEGQT